jgi:hypothetical protein
VVVTGDRVTFEDLSKAGEVFDQRETPFWSRAGMGPALKNHLLYSEGIDTMAKRLTKGTPEGKDVEGFEKGKAKKLYGRGQKFRRYPAISTEAEEFSSASVSQLLADYNRLLGTKIKEQLRDIDVVVLSDQESADDDGVNGYYLRGAGRWINDGATGAATEVGLDSPNSGTASLAFNDTQTAPDVSVRTPAAQIYSGALADFDEVALNNMMLNRAKHAGNVMDFTLWCGYALKGQISSNFGRYQADKAGYTAIARTEVAPIDKRKLVTTGIDVFEGDYGNITVELEPWMPTNARGYGVEMSVIRKRIGYLTRHYPLENKGGGKRGLVESILSIWFDDPRRHFKVAPSDEVAAVYDFEF